MNSTGVYWWYVTLHHKFHMVGYIGTLYGSTFFLVKPSRRPRIYSYDWFKISLTKATMLNDEDYRYASANKLTANTVLILFLDVMTLILK